VGTYRRRLFVAISHVSPRQRRRHCRAPYHCASCRYTRCQRFRPRRARVLSQRCCEQLPLCGLRAGSRTCYCKGRSGDDTAQGYAMPSGDLARCRAHTRESGRTSFFFVRKTYERAVERAHGYTAGTEIRVRGSFGRCRDRRQQQIWLHACTYCTIPSKGYC
jgi:hypothetical protein